MREDVKKLLYDLALIANAIELDDLSDIELGAKANEIREIVTAFRVLHSDSGKPKIPRDAVLSEDYFGSVVVETHRIRIVEDDDKRVDVPRSSVKRGPASYVKDDKWVDGVELTRDEVEIV